MPSRFLSFSGSIRRKIKELSDNHNNNDNGQESDMRYDLF